MAERTKPYKPSEGQYKALIAIFLFYGLGMGYYAGIQPTGEWRYFSWHPALMTVGMVTLSGISVVTKKMGGYTNTKIHGIMAWLGIFATLAGYYVIYQNKENNGANHLTTNHALAGVFVMGNMMIFGTVGGVVLHPDFGVDKTNKLIRLVHRTGARLILIMAWFTAYLGLYQLIPNEPAKLLTYAAPLICLLPYSLM